MDRLAHALKWNPDQLVLRPFAELPVIQEQFRIFQKGRWRTFYVKHKHPHDIVFPRLFNRFTGAQYKLQFEPCAPFPELLGCDAVAPCEHVSARFQPHMTWRNAHRWHLDHIRPIASYDLSLHDHQRACFHISNVQPLWSQQNLRKSDKWDNASHAS